MMMKPQSMPTFHNITMECRKCSSGGPGLAVSNLYSSIILDPENESRMIVAIKFQLTWNFLRSGILTVNHTSFQRSGLRISRVA